ncbi:MAG: hypothetical protein ACREKL_05170 [Chthoniobacterales bacterium]
MKRLIIAASCSVFASLAQASLLLNVDFNSPTYSTGPLVGQDSWTQVGATATSPIQVASGAVGPLVQGSAQDAVHAFSAVTSGSLYYSVALNFTSKNTTADYALTLGDGGASSFGGRLYAKSSGAGYVLAWGGSSTAPATFGVELAFSTTYNVVFRYDIVSGLANDTGKLYVSTSPFTLSEGSYTAYQDVTTWTGGTEVTSFAGAYIRQGTNSGVLTLDNYQVGTTFKDVTPVPEPHEYAIAMAGLLGAIILMRRRRMVA